MTYFIASSSSLPDSHAVRRTTSQEIDSSTREILTSPVLELVQTFCGPPHAAGNGAGPEGVCLGTETAPPCGPGAVPGRYYPCTLPLRCDGLVVFDGKL